ncbi:MAG: Gfo/Idh/MocA family oxidoreductase [Bacteroidales bacterium]|nr:Gfo/Idh/MocA family oxidoreductase [Bacteroidales bacterium]
MKNISSRRKFIKKTIASGIGIAVFPQIIPASALGKNGYVAPSNRISMAVIGAGSQGMGDAKWFNRNNEIQFIAACDVDKAHRDRAKLVFDNHNNNTDTRTYLDYRELLEKEKVDAMLIALPDHWHGAISTAVASKGIDIYGEKPLARTIKEGRAIVNAVAKNDIIWQTGSWQRSKANFHRACELVINEKIGKVKYVEVGLPDAPKLIGTPPVMPVPEGLDWEFWLGPAPTKPYRGVSHWDWRWIMDYSGGQLTDWAGHHIDIAHWGLGLDRSGPIEIEGKGVYPYEGIFDVPLEYDFMCKYENGVNIRVANRSRLPYGQGATWYGENGWIHVDRSKLTAENPAVLEEKIGEDEIHLYRSADHVRNFIECIKSREETITPAEIAYRSISVALLGEIAMLTGQKLNWDPEKEVFINNINANRLLSRPFRGSWSLTE